MTLIDPEARRKKQRAVRKALRASQEMLLKSSLLPAPCPMRKRTGPLSLLCRAYAERSTLLPTKDLCAFSALHRR